MRKWLFVLGIAIVGGTFVATEVDARRLGGGRNIGAQRNVTTPPQQTPAKPAQQQQNAQGQQQGAQQAAPAKSGSRWMPILGGLALGGMLGYLFGGSGLLGFLLLGLLAIAAVLGVRALMRRRAEAPRPVQFAGMRETVSINSESHGSAPVAATTRVPAGFDARGFLRGAKMNFLRLQAANDAGRLDEIRELTTEELFEQLRKDAGGIQHTQVEGLDAELLQVVTEGPQHWASVRFTGTVREAPGAAPESFLEVWNLVKPADGSSGWLLAGIQQMH
jgi:predicted lipid-binding transport protein (Tim44 family)